MKKKKTNYYNKTDRAYYLRNRKKINKQINYFQKLGRLANKNGFSISSDGELIYPTEKKLLKNP